MIEFLTDNARKAYPFAKTWPSTVNQDWARVFVDASVGYAKIPDSTTRIVMTQIAKSTPKGIDVQLWCGSDGCTVHIPYGCKKHQAVFGGSSTIKAMLTVNGPAVDALYDNASTWDKAGKLMVEMPFVTRCVSFATDRVTSISAYSAELCSTPVFQGDEEPVLTISDGDMLLVAKEGVDVERTTLLPITDELLRVSALAAPNASEDVDDVIDIMIRGDECFTVENYPGAKVVGGTIEKRTAEDPGGVLQGGIIRLGTKCKPCCQCEDYKGAFDALRPADTKMRSIKTMLDEAKVLYESAVTAFNAAKESAKDTVNSYDNVRLSANGVPSGGLYDGSTASGMRRRVAITLTITNMTQLSLDVGTLDPFFIVPGFTLVSMVWRTAGSNPRTRSGLPETVPQWTLKPGDSLVVVATYGKVGSSNDTTVPYGSKVNISLKLAGKASVTKSIDVK